MESKLREEKIKCLGLWTLKERGKRQDLTEIFKMFEDHLVSVFRMFNLDENRKCTREPLSET